MMSFSQVRSAGTAADYYTNKDNYYVLGSLDERWFGKGAALLELSGNVDKKAFTAVLEGKLPDGSDLTFMKNGENRHRPGYDLTFSAPKSVSVMALLGGDKRLIEAHNKAVEVALGQVERLAAVRSMTDGKSETVLTGNIIAALFNHDTSRDLDPQLHTHAVVANATHNGEKWQALASDTVGKTGFSEAVLANQIALGQIYRHTLRQQVEAMGYRVEVVGKHGMWEMPGVPVEIFSKRSQAINAAVGEDASLKSLDMATLDTRQHKSTYDPAALLKQWIQEVKATGFDVMGYRAQAAKNTLQVPQPAILSDLRPEQIQVAVGQALSLLSERQAQFTYSELLARTVSQLPGEPGVFDRAREGIDAAIEQQRLIPLDQEKGLFTSDIQLLDELSLRSLAQQHLKQGAVVASPPLGAPENLSDAVRQLMASAPSVAVMSGIGGATVRRERVAELVTLTQSQGREAQILTPDRKSAQYLAEHRELAGVAMPGRASVTQGLLFTPNSTLIVDQAEKFTLKEMVTLADGARRHNVQLVLMDNQQRKGTGNALSILREEAPVFRYQRAQQVQAAIISESVKDARFAMLARHYARTVAQGIEGVAQVSGPRDQQVLAAAIRDALKTQGALSQTEQSIAVLTPVWLDARSRASRDSYREGMVMERWDSDARQRERYVIDRVTPQSNTLTLVNAAGERRLEKVRQLDSQWSLYQPGVLPVSDGERVQVLAREADGKLRAGERLEARLLSSGELRLTRAGSRKAVTVQAGHDLFSALKLGQGYVEGLGASVSDRARVFASVTQRDLNQATLNQLSRSGQKIVLYSALDREKTASKLARNPHYLPVTEQVKQRAGEASLETAMQRQKNALFTPVQQAIHLALPSLERQRMAFSRPALVAGALGFGEKALTAAEVEKEITAQVRNGALVNVDVADGFGTRLLVTRSSFETEKSIIGLIAQGKNAVAPLMGRVPDAVLQGLTAGQQAATKLILETPDRFVVVQGYAGVGKTTQFKAVLAAVGSLPENSRPRVVGLAPTHRAVGEMQAAGVSAQTLASFLYDEGRKVAAGEQVNYENTLFVVDESSMIGNVEMARAYALIAAGKGRAVVSGDSAQLQPIAAGQPFRLQQIRSAADVAVMKDIVRQTPELKPAIYRMIEGKTGDALDVVAQVTPQTVPRTDDAWLPDASVMEIKTKKGGKAVSGAERTFTLPLDTAAKTQQPETVREAIVRDWLGRTPEARDNTLIITHLNDDRREINARIHEERVKRGELGGPEITFPVLLNTNIPDGDLRRLETWSMNRKALALKDRVYWQIADIHAENGTVTLRDAQGREQVLSPREASQEAVTLYQPDTVTVSAGDRVRFGKSDVERGFVANSVWQVVSASPGRLVLSDGKQTRTLSPGREQEHAHIDLAYAITAHGAQGASESFAITLEGTEGGRKRMVSHAAAYVALSRARQHVQVYTDDKAAWMAALAKVRERASAHDVLQVGDDRLRHHGEEILTQGSPLDSVAQGRALLRASGLTGQSLAQFVSRGKKSPQSYVSLPVYDANGKIAGAWVAPLGRGQPEVWGSDRAAVVGNKAATFAALQRSQNGETCLAGSMAEGVRLAVAHPQSGIVVRLGGEEVPYNPGAMTGGRVWGDIALVPSAQPNPPLPHDLPAVPDDGLAKMRRELEAQAEKAAKAFGRKNAAPDIPLPGHVQAIIDREEKAGPPLSPEQARAIRAVLAQPEPRPGEDAVRQVAQENLQRERLQQMERELVRDLEKEKWPGE